MSPMLDPYLVAAHGMQALRRRTDRDNNALLGALGVAVDPLPHQIASVRRILEAHEIRHLIADGVGLGKTVQTLMVINALRLANPRHRTLLLAPDHLLMQWYEELSIRGHLSASLQLDRDDAGEEVDLERPIRLAKPGSWIEDDHLRRSAASNFDLLVIDEPQLLSVRVRDSIASADSFSQFLALSATPGFGDAGMRDWLLTMLEPERSALASQTGNSPSEAIKADEKTAISEIITGGNMAALWQRDALGRRICRWSRDEWPTITPKRIPSRSHVVPFIRESNLAELATQTMRSALEQGIDTLTTDPARKAQNLHRLGSSARRAGGTDILNASDATGIDLRGDSRFDALLDHLSSIWHHQPEARVLIVAGDSDTIERLELRLPAYFVDAATGKPISMRAFSRQSSREVNEANAMRSAHETLDEFVNGNDKILLIDESAQAGLNLHHSAQELIFYSCPWKHDEIDQLIGRLDRISKGAESLANKKRTPHRLGIHVITWDRSPEARVVDGLDALGVFKQPIPPANEATRKAIKRCLYDLAANRNIEGAIAELRAFGEDASLDVALSELAVANPYKPEGAWQLYRNIAEQPSLPAALPDGKFSDGARGVEEANLSGWLIALNQTRVLDIRFGQKDKINPEIRYSTAWYPDTGSRTSGDQRPLTIGLFERRYEGDYRATSATGMVAFNTKRQHLPQPPRMEVTDRRGEPYPLAFFDHGDSVHEDLCSELLKQGDVLLSDVQDAALVEYPPDHAALTQQGAVLLSVVRSAPDLPPPDQASVDHAVAGIRSDQDADRKSALRRFYAGVQADDRWLRLRAPGSLHLAGARWSDRDSIWTDLTTDEAAIYLDPRSGEKGSKKGATQRSRKPQPSIALRRALPNQIAVHHAQSGVRFVGHHGSETDARCVLIECDHNRLALMRAGEAKAKRNQTNYDVRVEGEAARIDRLSEAEAALNALRIGRLQSLKKISVRTVNDWNILLFPIARET